MCLITNMDEKKTCGDEWRGTGRGWREWKYSDLSLHICDLGYWSPCTNKIRMGFGNISYY